MSGHLLLDPQRPPMEVLNTDCEVDDIVGCSVCFNSNHKSCAHDTMRCIPENVQSKFPEDQVNQINNLTEAIKTMKKLETQHDRLDDNLDKNKATCKQEIQKYREEINQIIDKIEATTLAELDARHNYIKKNTFDTNPHDLHDEMLRFKSEIESGKSDDSQLFAVTESSQGFIMQAQALQSKFSSVQTTELTFTRNTDIVTFLMSIATLGLLSNTVIQDSSFPTVATSCKQPQSKQPKQLSASNDSSNETKVIPKQDTISKVPTEKQNQSLTNVLDKLERGDTSIKRPFDKSAYGFISPYSKGNGYSWSKQYMTSSPTATDSSTITRVSTEKDTCHKKSMKTQNQSLHKVSDKSEEENMFKKQPVDKSVCGTLSTQSITSASASTDNDYNTLSFTRQETGRKVFRKPHNPGLYKVLDKSEYTIKQADDKSDCDIMSSCILDFGNILLADYQNSNLKLVDRTTNTVKSSLGLNGKPRSVCRVSSTEVAVCLDNNKIHFVSTSGAKHVPVRSMRMNHVSSCITVIRDKIYVGGQQYVLIYTLNGELVHTIRKDKSGNDIFSHVWTITVSDDEKKIHVVDLTVGVVTLNTDGNVLWKYLGKELGRAYGLCTDGNGNMIVSGDTSNSVIQLGPHGQYIGHIISHSDGLISPHSVCYDRYTHQLIVGRANNKNITVLTLR